MKVESITESAYLTKFTHLHSQTTPPQYLLLYKVSKGAKIRNRYNKVPHLTQDTNKV